MTDANARRSLEEHKNPQHAVLLVLALQHLVEDIEHDLLRRRKFGETVLTSSFATQDQFASELHQRRGKPLQDTDGSGGLRLLRVPVGPPASKKPRVV